MTTVIGIPDAGGFPWMTPQWDAVVAIRFKAGSSTTCTRPTAPLMMPSRSKRRSTRIAVSTVVPEASASARRVTRASPSRVERSSARANRAGAGS